MSTMDVAPRERGSLGIRRRPGLSKRSKPVAMSPGKKRVVFDDVSNQAKQTRNSERNQGSKSVEDLHKPSKIQKSRLSRNSVPVPLESKQAPPKPARGASLKSKIPIRAGTPKFTRKPVPAKSALIVELPSQLKIPSGVDDVDGQTEDLFFCPEYSNDVIQYQHEKEARYSLPHKFLTSSEITPHMRGVLVDWLTQVQVHLDLATDTLHQAVAMSDQILGRGGVSLGRLQLLGVTALLIAAKYNERFPPAIEQLIHLTDHTYTFEQVIRMERRLLRALQFFVDIPIPLTFLRRYLHVLNTLKGEQLQAEGIKLENLSYYLLDVALADAQATKFHPSLRAAAAIYLSTKLVCEASGVTEVSWDRNLIYYTTYTEPELMPCVIKMAKLLLAAKQSKFKGAWEKYSSRSQHGAISKWEHFGASKLLSTLARSKAV